MKIEFIPLKMTEDVFNDYSEEILNLQKSKYCYVTNIDLIGKLLITEMPIKNNRLAIKNILKFLTYIDVEINQKNKTILSIHTDNLIEYFGRDTYKEYMNILKEFNILTDVPYEDGSFYLRPDRENKKPGLPKRYRVHNEYLSNKDLCIVILEEDRSKDKFICDIDIDNRFIKTIKDLDINMKEAIIDEIKHCNENNLSSNNLRIRISRLFYTRMKRFIKYGSKVNRIYHSFTNVSKVSRRHLNIKLYNIDIKNSQPLILVSYLKKNNLPLDDNYINDCETGIFYDRFISKDFTRDDVKVALYKNIFFGFFTKSKINKTFKELYPLTWNSLNEISKEDISLAERLQNLESELFNNLVPEKSKSYFTLFDAIYFDNINDMVKLQKNITKFFNNIGVSVTTNIEY